ncbi:WAT1-related protein [Spatholobus suberectus]|nr:WAT1-related protein [Spatholobus suberectus]
MKDMLNLLQRLKPDMLMVFVQVALAAVNVIYKLAINDGMSMRVATAYRLIFASAFTVPLALIFDRSIIVLQSFILMHLLFNIALVGGKWREKKKFL